jgi:hypothetical protein
MGKGRPMTMTTGPNVPRLLALCARLADTPSHNALVAQAAGEITDWRLLLKIAENQNMGPLLYHHLSSSQVAMPANSRHELKGIYLRHRQTNRIRGEVLAEILALFEANRIEALLLKGVALAHLVYPQPGLRPMRDMDLLIHPEQVWEAQGLLAKAGFTAPPEYAAGKSYHHHLAGATKKVGGLSISVELHHTVFLEELGLSLDMTSLTVPPVIFQLPGGQLARTLGAEDMLWHVCHHMADIWQPFRWIWLVDSVATAEKFVDDINWPNVKQSYPRITASLSLFHTVTPLSDHLVEAADLNIGPPPPGVGQEFSGWPRHSVGLQRQHKRWPAIIRDTFLPPEWWLRLYYGLDSGSPITFTRWVSHPMHIAAFGRQLLKDRFA